MEIGAGVAGGVLAAATEDEEDDGGDGDDEERDADAETDGEGVVAAGVVLSCVVCVVRRG